MAHCKHCNVALTPKEAAERACPVCNGVLNDSVVESSPSAVAPHLDSDLQSRLNALQDKAKNLSQRTAPRDADCLICGESKPTEPRFVRVYTIQLQYRQKTTRWVDLRCNCCSTCQGKIRWFQRMRAANFPLFVLFAVATFAGYTACLPLLLDVGAPGWLVGIGFVICPIGSWLFVDAIIKGFSKGILSEQGIARFRSIGIGWDAGPRCGLVLVDQPTGGYADLT